MAGGQGPGSGCRAGAGNGRRSCHSHAIAIGACLLAVHGIYTSTGLCAITCTDGVLQLVAWALQRAAWWPRPQPLR